MMNYFQLYPLLTAELRFHVTDNDLSKDQSQYLLNRSLEENPDLAPEIVRSFEDPEFSWMEILIHPDVGEVYEAETEEEAREFAAEMFLKPAVSGHV